MSIEQHQEHLRLKAIAAFDPEGGPEESLDRMARLVGDVLEFPLALVSLVDDHRRIFKSRMMSGTQFGELRDSFCAVTIGQTAPLIVEDATLIDPYRNFGQVTQAPFIRSYWGAPLRTTAGFNVGTLTVLDTVPRTPTSRDLDLLEKFARMTVELMELRAAATIDVLTGTHTRRMFDVMGRNALRDARKTGSSISCIVLDIDHFKVVNDTHGHGVGDDVLSRVGELLNNAVRAGDIVGRIGGEEFGVVLPGVGLDTAFVIAERVRQRFENDSGTLLPKFTASLGVAELIAEDAALSDIVQRADGALYQAKHTGRNRTIRAGAVEDIAEKL